MYSFKKSYVGPHIVHVSYPKRGETHRKQFLENSTAETQETFNIYVEGEFEYSVPERGSVNLVSGQTTFDIPWDIPKGAIAEEKVLSSMAVRYCIANSKTRKVIPVTQSVPLEDVTVFVLSGLINHSGKLVTRGAFFHIESGSISGNGSVLLIT